MQANAASLRILSVKHPDIQIVFEGKSFAIPDDEAKGGTAVFEVDGLLLSSTIAAVVESKTGLAAKDVKKVLRTGGLVKKHCHKLGLSVQHAELLAKSEMIHILARPAVTDDLLEAIVDCDPKICVIADSGGALQLVRDGVGLNPADVAGGGTIKGGVGAGEEGMRGLRESGMTMEHRGRCGFNNGFEVSGTQCPPSIPLGVDHCN